MQTVCYADAARQITVTVSENVRIARDTFRLRFRAPEMARRITPGQFLMLRLLGADDPLLARPLALYDTAPDEPGHPAAIDVVYLVVGKMTRRLAVASAGQPLEAWGPLGNGFDPRPTEHLVMVAGGIGQTPFMALAREALGVQRFGEPTRPSGWAGRVTLCYGARSSDYLAGLDEFRALGVEVRISTDDGTAGHSGRVTDLLAEVLDESPRARFVCCGPEKMMQAAAELCHTRQASCEVSLESPMACGVGICFSCVAKVRDDAKTWDYRRTCVEGPVFDSSQIVW